MQQAACTAVLIILLAGAAVLLWILFDIVLLTFAAILIAVVIRGPVSWLTDKTQLSTRVALAVTLIAFGGIVVVLSWFFGSSIVEQSSQFTQELPSLFERAQRMIGSSQWLPAPHTLDPGALLQRSGAWLGRGMNAIAATFGAIANVALVAFMAVLSSVQPQLYRRGVLGLLPQKRRARIDEVFSSIGFALRRWTLGQFALMTFVAIATGLGLWLLGVRYALVLSLLAGLLTFIPFVGPIIAGLVAVAVSIAGGWQLAAYVALLYIGVQIVEGVLEPFVQHKTVYLPPVLVLLAQVTFGVLAGALGVILATPLAAALMVAVKMLYVQDVLGDRGSTSAG